MPKRIEDETALLPHVIADSVIRELFLLARDTYAAMPTLSETEDAVTYLTDYAETVYQANPDWRKKIKRGMSGRDYLYSFMRHWLAGYAKVHWPSLFGLIPESFRVGVEYRSKANV